MTSEQHRIDPRHVTKPIQLLAAWLVGLILVDGAFLTAVTQMDTASWERSALVIAAIINVPLFLVALFLLQTRFRPELQEDVYYSQYLDKKTNTIVRIGRDEAIDKDLSAIRSELRMLASESLSRDVSKDNPECRTQLGHRWKIAINKNLPNLDAVRALFKEHSIPLSDIFGTSEPPKSQTIAMADNMDFASKLQLLELACKMNMDSYTYFDPAEEGTEEHILIGSYGGARYPISQELEKLIQSKPEKIDLRIYEQQHDGKSSRG